MVSELRAALSKGVVFQGLQCWKHPSSVTGRVWLEGFYSSQASALCCPMVYPNSGSKCCLW